MNYLIKLLLALMLLLPVTYTSQNTENTPFQFPSTTQLLNTKKSVTIDQLFNSKIAVLYFWNTNNLQSVNGLNEINRLYNENDQFNLIGIHCPQNETENDDAFIQKKLLLYEITFPGINDTDLNTNNGFDITNLPSYIILNSDGEIIFKRETFLSMDSLKDIITSKIHEENPENKTIFPRQNTTPPMGKEKFTLLSNPTCIAVDTLGARLFIGDSGHNRIVYTTHDGVIMGFAGTGEPGNKDGSITHAQFNHPEGITFDANNNWLYIADTENKAIRKIDLTKRIVTTITDLNTLESSAGIKFGRPGKITLNNDNLIWLDMDHSKMVKYSIKTKKTSWYPQQDTSKETDRTTNPFINTSSIASSHNGKLYISTLSPANLYQLNDKNTKLSWSHSSTNQSTVEQINSMIVQEGNIYLLDSYSDQLIILDETSKQLNNIISLKNQHSIETKGAMDIGKFGNYLYIVNTLNNTIEVWNTDNNILSPLALKSLDLLFPLKSQQGTLNVVDTINLSKEGQTELKLTISPPKDHIYNPNAKSNVYNYDRAEIVFDSHRLDASQKTLIVFAEDVKYHINISGTIQYCHKDHANWCYRQEYNFILPVVFKNQIKEVQQINLSIEH